MEVKTIRTEAKAIQDRFFQALDALVVKGRLGGLQTFCKEYDLNRTKYSGIRNNQNKTEKRVKEYKFIDIDALAYMVKDYGVSADWLLAGKGEMFRIILYLS